MKESEEPWSDRLPADEESPIKVWAKEICQLATERIAELENLMTQEQWRPVRGFEGAYEVSNLGRVRALFGYHRWKPGRILKPYDTGAGYLAVKLYKGKRGKNFKVHILVAQVFIPNPENLPEVDHLGAKADCRASKLKWSTKRQNEEHAMQSAQKGDGVYADGEKWVASYSPKPYTRKFLGIFDTKREALAARRAAVKEITCEGDAGEHRTE